MRVLIINQWATNKGDRAVLYFLLRELARNRIEQVTVSTSEPAYWRERPDFPDGVRPEIISSGWSMCSGKSWGVLGRAARAAQAHVKRRLHFPLVRSALIAGRRPAWLPLVCSRAYLRAVEEADLVLSTGGHRITTINTPDAAGPQTFDMAVALLCGKPFVIWSQSIGPFNFKEDANRQMVKAILAGASQILIRNEGSREQIQQMGVSLDHVRLTHESVLGLYDVVVDRTRPSTRPPVMGVSIYATNRRDPESFREYVGVMAGLVDHALLRGYERIRFFPMELAGSDRSCIQAIIGAVRGKEHCEIVEGFPGTAEHINEISRCRLFVGHKTHSVIFSLVAGTPLLAIAYHQKTQDFMTQFGLAEQCVSDRELSRERLIVAFDDVNDNLDAMHRQEEHVASALCTQTQADFASMLREMKA